LGVVVSLVDDHEIPRGRIDMLQERLTFAAGSSEEIMINNIETGADL
jgi:hypothetical protein